MEQLLGLSQGARSRGYREALSEIRAKIDGFFTERLCAHCSEWPEGNVCVCEDPSQEDMLAFLNSLRGM